MHLPLATTRQRSWDHAFGAVPGTPGTRATLATTRITEPATSQTPIRNVVRLAAAKHLSDTIQCTQDNCFNRLRGIPRPTAPVSMSPSRVGGVAQSLDGVLPH